jgi:predicted amidohydrolase
VFEIRGVRCGVLICHEYRYPELYRQYKRADVELVFHSYHTGHLPRKVLAVLQAQVGRSLHRFNNGTTLPAITMPATMQAAASNHVWISCSNTSARESCWPSFFVRPDGVITGRLRLNTAGILVSTVDRKEKFYDAAQFWRARAMRGVLHSGVQVRDERSDRRDRV